MDINQGFVSFPVSHRWLLIGLKLFNNFNPLKINIIKIKLIKNQNAENFFSEQIHFAFEWTNSKVMRKYSDCTELGTKFRNC